MSDIDEYHSGSGLANNQQQVVRRGERERGRAGTTGRATDEDHMGTTGRVGLTMDEGAAGHEQRKRGGTQVDHVEWRRQTRGTWVQQAWPYSDGGRGGTQEQRVGRIDGGCGGSIDLVERGQLISHNP